MSLKLSPNATRAILTLLPKELPPSLQSKSGNLCQVLSRYPRDGVGKVVHQSRWSQKGIHGCYWQVTRTQLKLEGKHGKAWGRLVWKGEQIGEPARGAHPWFIEIQLDERVFMTSHTQSLATTSPPVVKAVKDAEASV